MTREEQTMISEYENKQFTLGQLPGGWWVCIFRADSEHSYLVHNNPKWGNHNPTMLVLIYPKKAQESGPNICGYTYRRLPECELVF